MDPQEISAFIIAGGRSIRFGEDKTVYKYRGRPLIEHVIESVRPVIPDIAIVADDVDKFKYLGIPCYPDIVSGIGPLGGIYTALVNAKTERALIVASDMPDLNADLIRYIISESKGYDATIPFVDGRYEPLHAVYAKTCINVIEKSLEKGNRQVIGFFNDISMRKITKEEISAFVDPKRAFSNINFRHDVPDEDRHKKKSIAMNNHSLYFTERAKKLIDAGILNNAMVDFYTALYEYNFREYERYRNLPDGLSPIAAETTALAVKNRLFEDAVLKLILPGLDSLLSLMAHHHPDLVLEQLRRSIAEDSKTGKELIQALLEKNFSKIEQIAHLNKSGAEETVFILINWLKPFIVNLREQNLDRIIEDEKSVACPFCGYYPEMAALNPDENGKRYLHCALCEHRWPYKRIACSICGTEDGEKLEYFTPEGDERHRIDACDECGGYIKTVRLEKFEDIDKLHLTVENILTPHLDSAALQKGYRRP